MLSQISSNSRQDHTASPFGRYQFAPKLNFFFTFAILCSFLTGYQSLEGATIIADASLGGVQDWTSPWTWIGGNVPGPDDRAIIPQNVTVLLDGTNHIVRELVIQGTLVAEETTGVDRSLTSNWIHVNSGGVLRIGTANNRYDEAEFSILLTGENPNQTFTIEMAGCGCGCMGSCTVTNNDSFLMVGGGGRLQFFGDDKLSFTKLASTANVNSRQIIVENIIERNFDGTTSAASDGWLNWEVGDQIVIASSSQSYDDQEVRTISAITSAGGGTSRITLDSPLNNRHYGGIETYSNATREWEIDLRAEVALLSRNVRVEGESFHDTDNNFGDRRRYSPTLGNAGDGFGGHIMIMETAGQITVDGVQLDRLGQTSRLGRYPIHWHLGNDRSGDILRRTSITNSNNRGVTIHGAHNILLEGVVLHDIHGHGFFLEDGVETGNDFIANIAFGIHQVGRSGNDFDLGDPFIVDTHDHVGQNRERFFSSAAYWITNPDNTWIGNISAGADGTGFWFILPEFALGSSADDPQYDGVNANETNLRQFDHNSSHSSHVGLNFDRGRDIEVPVGATLQARFFGRRYQPPAEPQFNYFTAYQHHVGIYHRGDIANFHENRFADNFTSTFITFTQRITDSLYVGNSRNNADRSGPRTGHSLYDGANTLDGNHFAGFSGGNAFPFRNHGIGVRHVNHLLSNTSFERDGSMGAVSISTRSGGATQGNPLSQAAGTLYDVDGTLTGMVGGGAGYSVVANHPFFFDSDDFRPAGWNAVVSQDVYSMLFFDPDNGNADIRVTTPDGDSAMLARSGFSTHVKTGEGDYVVDFPGGVTSIADGLNIRYFGRQGPTGSTVIRFDGLASVLVPQNISRVNGLDNLRNANRTSFEIIDGDVWVKFFSSNRLVEFALATNNPPVAVDDTATTDQDSAVTIDVLNNDSDPDNDSLTVSLGPSNGGASIVVADYSDDFQTTPGPASGWQYLWNQNGQFGNVNNYSVMPVSGSRYSPVSERFLNLASGSGHPGNGIDNGAAFDGYPIAAYTVPSDGNYSIENSFLNRRNEHGDGVGVMLHVGNTVAQIGSIAPESTGDFDTDLGFLTAGTTIHIGVGPDGPGPGSSAGADFFTWDFSITRQTTNGGIQAVVNPDQTITFTPNPGFVGDVTLNYQISDGRGGFDSASVTIDTQAVANEVLYGDVDQNGAISFLDIGPFIALLQGGEYREEADVNQDGSVNFLDIGPFIATLQGT